jgi:biotin transport system substrate-specific component
MNNKKNKTLDMVYIALFAVLIAICSWISIPAVVPFTLQTFAVFCSVGLLGGKRGTLAILVYIILGAIGIPVFSGFKGGIGILFGSTGGYIIGFLFSGLIYWLITGLFGKKLMVSVIGMLAGLVICYTIGSIWYIIVYSGSNGVVDFATVFGWCVIPFIIPDLIKILVATILVKRLASYVEN